MVAKLTTYLLLLLRILNYAQTNFIERVRQDGYICSEHIVTTRDRYVLTLYRIRKSDYNSAKEVPVLLMHGLMQSSYDFLDTRPGEGWPYILADQGYDVWLGNNRGNIYSQNHTRLDLVKEEEYWNFSIDEMGKFDIPAFIDFILCKTKTITLNYMGFCQGAGALIITLATRPEYNDKVNLFIALAPLTRLTNTRSVLFKELSDGTLGIERFRAGSIGRVFTKGTLNVEVLSGHDKHACIDGLSIIDSCHAGSISSERLRMIHETFPAGTSEHNIKRYLQSMKTDKFQKFDFGDENDLLHRSKHPPEYKLEYVKVPVIMFNAIGDRLVTEPDIQWLKGKLRNVIELHTLPDPKWNHYDMVYSRQIKHVIFPLLNDHLEWYSFDYKK